MGFELYERQLPEAVQRERDAMLTDAVEHFKEQGYEHFAVDGLSGYGRPVEQRVPGGNVPIRVDVVAEAEGKPTLHALVATSTVLTDPLWGRRWQAMARLEDTASASRCVVLVHPEDLAQAQAYAAAWKLPKTLVQALSPRG